MTFFPILVYTKRVKKSKGESFRMKIGKKVAIGLLIAVTLILMINTKVQAAQGKVTTDTLKLRKEPNTTSGIIALLSLNDKFEVIEQDGEWYKIKIDDKEGYVKGEFVSVEGEVAETEKPTEPAPEQEPQPDSEPTQETSAEPEQTSEPSSERQVKKETALRSLPLFSSVTLKNVKEKEKVTVLTEKNRWAYIQADDQSGWVLLEDLGEVTEPEPEAEPTPTPEPTPEPTQTNKTGYINSDNVNLRQKDSTSSDIIRKLKINTELKVVSEGSKWAKVEVNGTVGYVSKEYISDKKTEVTSRSLTTERTVEEKKEETKQEEATVAQEQSESGASKADELIALAKTFLGNKYIYGASGPKNFDCSGYTQYLYKQYGISLPRTAAGQIKKGTAVEKSNLKKGDAVFFQDGARTKVGHVGIYIGGNNFIHSSSGKGEVTITSLSQNYYVVRYVGARRFLN